MNNILSIPVCKYNTNNFSQFQTCCLSQFSFFLQGKWSSKHSVLSLICWMNLSIRFFSSVPYRWCSNLSHLQRHCYTIAHHLWKLVFYHTYNVTAWRTGNIRKSSFPSIGASLNSCSDTVHRQSIASGPCHLSEAEFRQQISLSPDAYPSGETCLHNPNISEPISIWLHGSFLCMMINIWLLAWSS